VDSLYGPQQLALADGDIGGFTFDHAAFERAAHRVFREHGFTPEMLAAPEVQDLIKETFGSLDVAINYAVSTETPPELTAALRNNAFIFSGFKTYHSLSEVGLALTDPDGKVKPYDQFRRDVLAIDRKYNTNYLYAEYNHAVRSAQMAVKWNDITRDGDRYNLQYRTAGDERVREAHAALDGTTLPPSDPFWESYMPPNGWNCRCNVVQVLHDDYRQSDSSAAIAAGEACTSEPKQQIFRYNPGKQLKLFPPKHPYLPKGCAGCSYKNLNLAYNPASAKCRVCAEIRCQAAVTCAKSNYDKLRNDPDYTGVSFDERTGGLKATHVDHHLDKQSGVFETNAQEAGFKAGHSVILGPEPGVVFKKRYTEGTWDGLEFEVAGKNSFTSNAVLRGLKHCAAKKKTEVAIIAFKEDGFDLDVFNNALARYNGLEHLHDGQYLKFKKIICIQGTQIVHEITP
jgi:SPP1 gp7 family putative phage head morphogenesis protein